MQFQFSSRRKQQVKIYPSKGGIADLPLLRILLSNHQKSGEPSFWEVIDSFVLLAYARLAT